MSSTLLNVVPISWEADVQFLHHLLKIQPRISYNLIFHPFRPLTFVIFTTWAFQSPFITFLLILSLSFTRLITLNAFISTALLMFFDFVATAPVSTAYVNTSLQSYICELSTSFLHMRFLRMPEILEDLLS